MKREKRSPIHTDEAVKLFSSLLVDIKKLELSLAENSLSLQWCSEATNLLKKMHYQFLLIFEMSEVPIFCDGINYLDEYMNESLHLLDLCNLLRSAISGMNRYCLMVDIAVKKFSNERSFSASMHIDEIEKLEREYVKLYGLEKWKDANLHNIGLSKTKSKNNALCVADVMKRTMNIVCMLLCSAIFYPVPIEVDEEIYSGFPQLEPFSFSIRKLVCCLSGVRKGATNNSKPVLVETKLMEKAVVDIKAQMLMGVALDKEKLGKSIGSLQNSYLAFKEGLDMFDSVVTELFEEVVKGRNKLLGTVATFI